MDGVHLGVGLEKFFEEPRTGGQDALEGPDVLGVVVPVLGADLQVGVDPAFKEARQARGSTVEDLRHGELVDDKVSEDQDFEKTKA